MDVCRTCLGTDCLSPLFDNDNVLRRTNELLDVTGIKIEPNDLMPQVICEPCLDLVNGALQLRQQSALSHATLLESGYKREIKESDLEHGRNGEEEKCYDRDCEANSPENHDDSGSIPCITEEKKEEPEARNVDPKREADNKDVEAKTNAEDKRRYYNRNTPLNRMVTVKGDTYNVKVEIGNVIWESEIKKDAKSMFKRVLKKSYKCDVKMKNERKCNYLKRNESQSRGRGGAKTKRIAKRKKSIKEESEESNSGSDFDNDAYLEKISKAAKTDEEDIGLFDHLILKKRRTMTKEKLELFTELAVKPYSKKGPVKCKVCHKVLMNFRNFLNHCKIHFAAENTCETCGKEFVSRNSMRYHQMRLHGVEKMHKCKYCEYKGVDVYQMKNHERRVHTGEKPFVCNECGASFHLRAGIAQHMRKHFGVKSIQCDRCPSMFRSRNELTTHRNKVHLMHYTYYCYLCYEKYRAVGTVRKHLVRRHGVPREQQLAIPLSKARRSSEIAEGIPAGGWHTEVHQEQLLSY